MSEPSDRAEPNPTIDSAAGDTAPRGAAETLDPSANQPASGGDAASPLRTVDYTPSDIKGGHSVAAQQMPAAGASPGRHVVAGYEILGELGRGGMGVVYQARQTALNRLVALKMILAGSHAGQEQLVRFRAEAEAVAHLQHANIVQIYEVGEQDGLPYFSLEFVDGQSLAEKTDGKPQRPEWAAAMIETLARAIHYAHRHGIVHRDLKPSNVLLTADGVPKISDFGLAKRLEGDSSQTKTGTILGTPSYMAPEQGLGQRDVGPLADVYALGSMLYELLTGRPPFLGASSVDTLMQLLHDEPVPPSRLQPKVSRDLETICLKCLRKDPRKRYETAEELAEDLRRFQAGEPILARPIGRAGRLWRWCRRNPRVAAASALALFLALTIMIGGPAAALIINQQKRLAINARNLEAEARQLAQHNAEAAKIAQSQAEKNEQKAVAAQKAADENARLATSQSKLALDSLYTLVTEVQGQLADEPATHGLMQKLLETALAGLRQVARTQQTARRADVTMAIARQRMGTILEYLGRHREARDEYQKCHEIIQAIAAASPNSPGAMRNLSTSYNLLGNISHLLGETDAARDYYSKALKLREALLAQNPRSARERIDLATSHTKMGDVSGPEEAERYYKAALELRKQLAAEAAATERAPRQRDVWVAYNTLGGLCLRRNELAAAQEHYSASLKLANELCLADAKSIGAKQDLAASHLNLGNVKLRLGEKEAANQDYGQAVALLRPLASADPEKVPLQTDFALALARNGQHAEAAEKAEHLRGLAPENHRNLYNVACCYALCAGAASRGARDDELSSEERSLREDYAQKSIEAMTQAVAHGFDDLQLIQNDPDLAPVRDDADFKKLIKGRG